MTARDIRAMERERARLLARLQDQGGRGIDLAEEIDDMAREIGKAKRGLAAWHEARRPTP